MWFIFILNVLCSGFLFFCLFEAVCFLNFWFVLELLSFSVVPYFVFLSGGLNRRCLLQYVVVLLVSSFFLVFGLLSLDFRNIFISVGVMIKLGVFPFLFWAYDVIVFSNWVVVWIVSGILKVSFILVFYVRGAEVNSLILVMCFLSFVFLTLSFWKFSLSWRHCWCHMMLSGSAGLVVVSLSSSFSSVFYLFAVYLVWCSFVLWFFSWLDCSGFSGLMSLLFLFFLVSFPFSLAILYKLVLSVSILVSSFFVFCAWCVYTVSEQLFLMFLLVSGVRIRSFVSLLSSV